MTTAVVQQAVDASQTLQQQQDLTVQLQDLQFSYPGCGKFLKGVSLDLPRGSRALLLGANGAGKTTLLQLIAGKYMVGRDSIRVLQRSPFFDMVSQPTGHHSLVIQRSRTIVNLVPSDTHKQSNVTSTCIHMPPARAVHVLRHVHATPHV
jgi:ABC-type transport system involved in cytochrome bd biosynthesis fused ATPase/permease subunit